MSNRFVVFDIDPKLIHVYQKVLRGILPENTTFEVSDVRKLDGVTCYVSPANSHGVMDGGIDEIYMEMFENIESQVIEKIKALDLTRNRFGKPLLPIGSAFKIDTAVAGKTLICAPTMEIPHNIRKSPENIYFAAYAIFKLAQKMEDQVIAIPGLGTGVGGIMPKESALLIGQAYQDCGNGVYRYSFPDDLRISETGGEEYLFSKAFLF